MPASVAALLDAEDSMAAQENRVLGNAGEQWRAVRTREGGACALLGMHVSAAPPAPALLKPSGPGPVAAGALPLHHQTAPAAGDDVNALLAGLDDSIFEYNG